jgi:hypothetical protein
MHLLQTILQKQLPAGDRAEKLALSPGHYSLSQRIARSDKKSLMRRIDFWKI